MFQFGRVVVIWNPSAGAASDAGELLEHLRQLEHVEIRQPTNREAAIEDVARACETDPDLLIAAGGDGTVCSVVEGVLHSEQRPLLGILPMGTGNDLARTLEIPLEPAAALRVFSSSDTREIDAARYATGGETRWYVNMLTGGNTGRYLERMTDEAKRMWGPFSYMRGIIDAVQDLQTFEVRVTCDQGQTESFTALNVFAANGRMSGGGLAISPEAEPDDGLLDLVVVQDGNPGEIAGLTAEYLLADYLRHPLVAFRRAREIQITSDPPLPLTADGERVGNSPCTVTIEPRRLRFLVPGGASG